MAAYLVTLLRVVKGTESTFCYPVQEKSKAAAARKAEADNPGWESTKVDVEDC